MSDRSIEPMNKALSDAPTLAQSGSRSNGNKGVPRPKAPVPLKPHHQIVSCHIQDTQ